MQKLMVNAGLLVALLGIMSAPLYAGDMDDHESSSLQNIATLKGVPESVEDGSIKVDETSELQTAELAKVGIDEAVSIAQKALVGTVIEAKLDDDDDYLVWVIEMVTPSQQIAELKVDAGNGKILAAEWDEQDCWWKFWK